MIICSLEQLFEREEELAQQKGLRDYDLICIWLVFTYVLSIPHQS